MPLLDPDAMASVEAALAALPAPGLGSAVDQPVNFGVAAAPAGAVVGVVGWVVDVVVVGSGAGWVVVVVGSGVTA